MSGLWRNYGCVAKKFEIHSVSRKHEHNEFKVSSKLCLNLCSLKLLRLTCSLLRSIKLIIDYKRDWKRVWSTLGYSPQWSRYLSYWDLWQKKTILSMNCISIGKLTPNLCMQRKTLSFKWLKMGVNINFEEFFMEINLRRRKLVSSNIDYKNHIATHLEIFSKALDKLNTACDNIILMGDFNAEPEEVQMTVFFSI